MKNVEKMQKKLSADFGPFFSRFPDSSKTSEPDFDETPIFDTDFPAQARISNSQSDPGFFFEFSRTHVFGTFETQNRHLKKVSS